MFCSVQFRGISNILMKILTFLDFSVLFQTIVVKLSLTQWFLMRFWNTQIKSFQMVYHTGQSRLGNLELKG